jgi:multiple sugar transport system ATP-binding protein
MSQRTRETVANEQGADADDAHIRLKNVTKTFDDGEIVATDDVSVDIGRNEIVVLLGPSGCGKTTTLRCIAGLEIPDDGRIFVGDEEVTEYKPRDRDLAFVFQSIALFPHMSVRDNIRFGLDMKTDLDADAKEEKVRNAAEILGIEDLLDRKPGQLSGGQQQRVSLGRAMVMDPAAFLLDEPLSALDANLRDKMRIELQELQNELEKTMIFVTHDQEEAMTLGDRIMIMDEGRVQQVGSPREIYSDPRSLFVTQFIGSPSTNIVDGRVRTTGDALEIETDVFNVVLNTAEIDLDDGQQVTIGVRPEHLVFDDTDPDFTATVKVVEHLGDRDALYLDVDGRELTALVSEETVADGDEVSLRIERDEVWVFDTNGERLV